MKIRVNKIASSIMTNFSFLNPESPSEFDNVLTFKTYFVLLITKKAQELEFDSQKINDAIQKDFNSIKAEAREHGAFKVLYAIHSVEQLLNNNYSLIDMADSITSAREDLKSLFAGDLTKLESIYPALQEYYKEDEAQMLKLLQAEAVKHKAVELAYFCDLHSLQLDFSTPYGDSIASAQEDLGTPNNAFVSKTLPRLFAGLEQEEIKDLQVSFVARQMNSVDNYYQKFDWSKVGDDPTDFAEDLFIEACHKGLDHTAFFMLEHNSALIQGLDIVDVLLSSHYDDVQMLALDLIDDATPLADMDRMIEVLNTYDEGDIAQTMHDFIDASNPIALRLLLQSKPFLEMEYEARKELLQDLVIHAIEMDDPVSLDEIFAVGLTIEEIDEIDTSGLMDSIIEQEYRDDFKKMVMQEVESSGAASELISLAQFNEEDKKQWEAALEREVKNAVVVKLLEELSRQLGDEGPLTILPSIGDDEKSDLSEFTDSVVSDKFTAGLVKELMLKLGSDDEYEEQEEHPVKGLEKIQGQAPLYILGAIEESDKGMFDSWLHFIGVENINIVVDRDGNNPLQIALLSGNNEMAEHMLDNYLSNANVQHAILTHQNIGGENLLHIMPSTTDAEVLAKILNLEGIGDALAQEDRDGQTPIAATYHDTDKKDLYDAYSYVLLEEVGFPVEYDRDEDEDDGILNDMFFVYAKSDIQGLDAYYCEKLCPDSQELEFPAGTLDSWVRGRIEQDNLEGAEKAFLMMFQLLVENNQEQLVDLRAREQKVDSYGEDDYIIPECVYKEGVKDEDASSVSSMDSQESNAHQSNRWSTFSDESMTSKGSDFSLNSDSSGCFSEDDSNSPLDAGEKVQKAVLTFEALAKHGTYLDLSKAGKDEEASETDSVFEEEYQGYFKEDASNAKLPSLGVMGGDMQEGGWGTANTDFYY